jgi:hypothetical protein
VSSEGLCIGYDIGVTHRPNETTTLDAQATLTLVDPGDIIGLASQSVIRTFPVANESDAEYIPFAHIEFDQMDLPWRYSPGRHVGNKLRPWMTLVVFSEEDGEGTIAQPGPGKPLPVASLSLAVLPNNQSEAWAWAHGQVAGVTVDEATAANAEPGLGVSRLYSPRFLQPNKRYTAAVIPTFERGRKAGMGDEPGNVDVLQAAWTDGENLGTGTKAFPVYYSWQFQTGTTGSFAQLAERLEARPLPPDTGTRPMDVSFPGLGLAPPISVATGETTPQMKVEGALRGSQAVPTNWPPTERNAWATLLAPRVSAEPQLVGSTLVRQFVAPPLYGQWYAGNHKLDQATNRPWFFELNVDPRNRVAASLGTQVVQRKQDALMAGAWDQLAALRQANQSLSIIQLGRQVGESIWKRHVITADRDALFGLTKGAHSQVFADDARQQTVLGNFNRSPGVSATNSSTWNRLTAALGSVGRLQGRQFLPRDAIPSIKQRLNDQTLTTEPAPFSNEGIRTLSKVTDARVPSFLTADDHAAITSKTSEQLVFLGLVLTYVSRELYLRHQGDFWWILNRGFRLGGYFIRAGIDANVFGVKPSGNELPPSAQIASRPPMNLTPVLENGLVIPPPPTPAAVDNLAAGALRSALSSYSDRITMALDGVVSQGPADFNNNFGRITAGLEPGSVLRSYRNWRIKTTGIPLFEDDELDPIRFSPEFFQPMFPWLREISNEWILPGMGQVPAETVALVEPNQKFIEAFMVGLNHEMGRELLFHEYPTDQRGTYFQYFWSAQGAVLGPGEDLDQESFKDIRKITQWGNSPLGSNSPRRTPQGANVPHVVLLVRGEIVRRYPNMIVYAIESGSTNPNVTPAFKTGAEPLHPVFYGNLPPDAAVYGFELGPDWKTGDGWFFVLQEQPAEPKFGIDPADRQTRPTPFFVPADMASATTAAELATGLFQTPFRVAFHSSRLA